MLVIPAIDLRGGRCVRLQQGDYAKETVFGADPVAVAQQWVQQGAEFLHLVDLDGAKAGRPVNTALVAQIVRAAGVPCQLGGGLRSAEAIRQALDLGVVRAIVGTRAVRDPHWFARTAQELPGKLALGLDAKDGKVATDGWLGVSELSARELVQQYQDLPLAAIVYTDIAKDGMMQGPNFAATAELARAVAHPVIASGGITSYGDVLELERLGIGACILGRSLYEGTIDLGELLQRLKSISRND